MQKLIHGKRYNTETALKVVSSNCEMLYLKRTGEFFLEKDGELIPLTDDEAKQWALDNHIEEAIYNKYFDENRSFGQKFKDLRRKAELTQLELSKLTEIPTRTIEDWERDLMLPPVYVQKLVIEKLETL